MPIFTRSIPPRFSQGWFFRCVVAFPFILALSLLFSARPVEKKMSLILVEHDMQAAQNHLQHIQRYTFINGECSPMQQVLSVQAQKPGEKTSYIRFDVGTNVIYKNRWVISGIGNIIDLQTKQIVLDKKDRFVKGTGDSLIFFTNDIFKGKYYSVFFLRNNTYGQVEDPSYRALPGKEVEVDCTLKNYKIYYYPPAAPKVELVKDAGYGEDVSLIASARPQCPIYWVDNDHFLYPNYSMNRDYVAIMLVSVSGRSSEKIGGIDQLPPNKKLSRFFVDADGNINYVCSRGYYNVNVKAKKVEALTELPVGNGFSIELSSDNPKGKTIKHAGKAIGTYFCDPELARTAPGCIAFPYEMVYEGEHFLQGAAAWTAESQKWKTLSGSELASVIGWIEE